MFVGRLNLREIIECKGFANTVESVLKNGHADREPPMNVRFDSVPIFTYDRGRAYKSNGNLHKDLDYSLMYILLELDLKTGSAAGDLVPSVDAFINQPGRVVGSAIVEYRKKMSTLLWQPDAEYSTQTLEDLEKQLDPIENPEEAMQILQHFGPVTMADFTYQDGIWRPNKPKQIAKFSWDLKDIAKRNEENMKFTHSRK